LLSEIAYLQQVARWQALPLESRILYLHPTIPKPANHSPRVSQQREKTALDREKHLKKRVAIRGIDVAFKDRQEQQGGFYERAYSNKNGRT